MKLVFIVSGEPLTITSHVSVVKNFLATDEIAGRDVIIWIIYIGIMIHRFRVEWSIGLDPYTTRCKGEARVGFSWRVKHRFAYTPPDARQSEDGYSWRVEHRFDLYSTRSQRLVIIIIYQTPSQ